MAWVKESGRPGQPGYTREGAGEAAMSPQEAAARGYRWEGTGGTYGRAPTQAEYYGIIGEKQRMGHYAGKPAEEQVSKELERGRREYGEKGPPWGTPERWHPYIKRGQFVSPDVEAFEARWSPYVAGDVFTGDEPQYAQYQHEREAAYAAQEKAFGSYSLEMGFRQQRLKEEHDRSLAAQSEALWAAGAFSGGKAPEPKEPIKAPLTRMGEWWDSVNRRLGETKPIREMRYSLLYTRAHLPSEMKEWPISPEFSFGEVQGIFEKPATAALTYGAFTAAPWALGRAGAALRPVSKAASEVFPKAGPAVAKWVPRAIGVGLGAGYGVSVEERVRRAESGTRAHELGKIYSTEVIPMFAGWETGRGILALRKIPSAAAVKSMREIYEYDVATAVKAETVTVPDAAARVRVRIASQSYPESALSPKEIARWQTRTGDLALPVEYRRTTLAGRTGVTEELGEGLMLVSRTRAEGIGKAFVQTKWSEGKLIRDVLDFGTPRGEYRYRYDILADPGKVTRMGIYPEGTAFGYRPRGYRFGMGGVAEELVAAKVSLADIGRTPKTGARFSKSLTEFTGWKPKALRETAFRLRRLQVGSGAPKRALRELEAEIMAAERAAAAQDTKAGAVFAQLTKQPARITQRQGGGMFTVIDTATSQESLPTVFRKTVQGTRFAPPEHIQRILGRRLVGFEEFYQPAPKEMFKTRGIVFPRMITSPREARFTAIDFRREMKSIPRYRERELASLGLSLKAVPLSLPAVAVKPFTVQIPAVDVGSLEIVEPRAIQAQKQEQALKTSLQLRTGVKTTAIREPPVWRQPIFPPAPIPLAWPLSGKRWERRKRKGKQKDSGWYIFNPVPGGRPLFSMKMKDFDFTLGTKKKRKSKK